MRRWSSANRTVNRQRGAASCCYLLVPQGVKETRGKLSSGAVKGVVQVHRG